MDKWQLTDEKMKQIENEIDESEGYFVEMSTIKFLIELEVNDARKRPLKEIQDLANMVNKERDRNQELQLGYCSYRATNQCLQQ
jgi:hypothetical protein